MPIDDETTAVTVAPPTGPIVSTSAAVELTWLVMSISEVSKHTSSDEEQVAAVRTEYPELIERIEKFWPDTGWWGELLVIADRSGTLLDPDPSALLASILAGVPDGPVALETENEHDRVAIVERLERLRGDAKLRKRYVAVLRELWDVTLGRFGDQADAETTAATWRERLAAGASPIDLLSDKHVGRRPEWIRAIRDATRNGTLVLTPVLCCRGGHLVATGSVISVAAPADARDSLAVRRHYAAEVASRLKVLSDPTRVALLSQLSCDPMSVTELARLYDLAQPTVSIHVRQLREAGLVEAKKTGGRTIYSVPHDRVQQLLDEAGDLLLRFCRNPGG
jgi:DNA-binding transcriptional ArsR family regulator